MISKIFGVTVRIQLCCPCCSPESEEDVQCIHIKRCETNFNFDHDTNVYIGNIREPKCRCYVGGSVKYSIVKPPSILVIYSSS